MTAVQTQTATSPLTHLLSTCYPSVQTVLASCCSANTDFNSPTTHSLLDCNPNPPSLTVLAGCCSVGCSCCSGNTYYSSPSIHLLDTTTYHVCWLLLCRLQLAQTFLNTNPFTSHHFLPCWLAAAVSAAAAAVLLLHTPRETAPGGEQHRRQQLQQIRGEKGGEGKQSGEGSEAGECEAESG